MAQDKQSPQGQSTALLNQAEKKLGLLHRLIRFFRKASVGIWSRPQLNTEIKNTLDCWQRACQFTNEAIKRKTTATFRLERFHAWLLQQEPEYKLHYAAALHTRQRKLEIEVYEANYNFKGLDQQERHYIKRLIKLKRLGCLIF